jgi:hypothetical protein
MAKLNFSSLFAVLKAVYAPGVRIAGSTIRNPQLSGYVGFIGRLQSEC